MYTVFPLVTVLLAKGLGFVESIYLRTQRDRIIPMWPVAYIIFGCGTYCAISRSFPKELVMLSLAIFIASSLGLILNSYLKISMHGISLGVMIAFICIVGLLSPINFGPYISLHWL
jgi:hypothetical protein